MAKTDEQATPEAIENLQRSLKESNEDRKRDKLVRTITRANEYRIQIWAQSELKIREAMAALEVLGGEPPQMLEPNFEDKDSLHHYASMTLTK